MITKDVREINRAIYAQAMNGRNTVTCSVSGRIFGARTRKGQLQVKLGSGQWVNVSAVRIDVH